MRNLRFSRARQTCPAPAVGGKGAATKKRRPQARLACRRHWHSESAFPAGTRRHPFPLTSAPGSCPFFAGWTERQGAHFLERRRGRGEPRLPAPAAFPAPEGIHFCLKAHPGLLSLLQAGGATAREELPFYFYSSRPFSAGQTGRQDAHLGGGGGKRKNAASCPRRFPESRKGGAGHPGADGPQPRRENNHFLRRNSTKAKRMEMTVSAETMSCDMLVAYSDRAGSERPSAR